MASNVHYGQIAAVPVGAGSTKLFSLSGRERLRLIFQRIGATIVFDARRARGFSKVLIVNADYIFEERILRDFAALRSTALISTNENGEMVMVGAICNASIAHDIATLVAHETPVRNIPANQLSIRTVSQVSGVFNQALRKRDPAFVSKVLPGEKTALERRLFSGSYKGATDFVTKFLLPEPAFHATRLAAALRLRPNLITCFSLLLVIATTIFFMRGEFVAGVITGWLMCFLDTVDGKLARVTLQSSKFGNLFDHGIDLIHPPFWYAAWASGAVALTNAQDVSSLWTALWIVNVGYVAGRLIEGYFVRRHKFEIHIWRPVDYWFRHITARRNPNLLMLSASAFAGAPAVGLYAIAVWTVVSTAFHFWRVIAAEQQARTRISHYPIQSWLAE